MTVLSAPDRKECHKKGSDRLGGGPPSRVKLSTFVKILEETREGPWLLKHATQLLLDIILNGAVKDGVLLCLNFSKMAQLANLVWLVEMALNLHPKSMWTYIELAQRNTKSMHPVMTWVRRLGNDAIPQLHEVLYIEDHLWKHLT